MKKNIYIAVFVVFAGNLVAQTTDDTLKFDDVIVVKEYEPTITSAFKISENPTDKDTVIPAPEAKYNVYTKQLPVEFEVEAIKAARMRGEPLDNLYRAYAKGGVGNYTNTYLEAYVNSSRSRKHNLGAHAKHFASLGKMKGYGYSGFSNNGLDVYGKKFLRKHLFSGGLDYGRDVYHYYGYNPDVFVNFDKTNTRQQFQTIGAAVSLKSFLSDSALINHSVDLNYHHYFDKYNVSEDYFKVVGDLSKYFNKELFVLKAAVDVENYQSNSTKFTNSIIQLAPGIRSQGERYLVHLGLNAMLDVNGGVTPHFYPDVYAKYTLIKDILIPYVGVEGGVIRNNYRSITQQNPFVSPESSLFNTNMNHHVYGGIRGAYSSKVSFNLQFSKRRYENYLMFTDDYFADPTLAYIGAFDNSFKTTADTATILTLSAEAGYKVDEKFNIAAKGEYNIFDFQNQLFPWYLPAIKASLSGFYDIQDKIIVRVDVIGMSDRFSRTWDAENASKELNGVYAKNIGPVLDFNLGVEYRYTNKLSAFINFNNLASNKYFYYNRYQSQRFNVMGGLTYHFWKD